MRGLIRRHLHLVSKSKTNIKPASPTPLNLKPYILPLNDLGLPGPYTPMIFFYSNPQSLAHKATIPNLLKNSLSNTLSKYYPFAGKLSSSGSRIEYNDQGIEFFEAQVACKLSEILEKTPTRDEEDGYGHLCPPGTIWGPLLSSGNLMAVQLNHFSCGGIAVAVSLSHCIADALTLLSFLSYWASLCRDPDNEEKLVHLSPTFLNELQQSSPPSCNDDLTAFEYSHPEKFWITTEIMFPNSKIAKLKAEVEMQDRQDGVNQSYTRNELVTALLYRCAVGAATASNSGAYTKSVLMQAVNMRPLLDPPLPKTSVGNLQALNEVPTTTLNETRLNTLIAQMKKGKMQLRGTKSLVGKNLLAQILEYAKTDHKPFFVSSICNFPLYDEMDFGWGRPVKAALVDIGLYNSAVLMDTPSGDGINTIIGLEEQDMKYFLADKDLLAYASF
ncbi:hypothetical protein DCAR_0624282 [Daucus carota subsp. sativus]|uniref:Transferase, Chloramphenicol acetyltransferase-like domain protein n=1 Tax=Daucus carota subsp. sativus TaxID=79200 RepID=A0AAF0XBQ4_DAUCS|nr:PREDICTED: deacetylvindoline O-acetyltransferase-like [Daucus carota subsp. sativus]WOH04870.1 hypothetical protein DCAR_0624282 [Daucus carota subsp. sativus]